MGLEPGELQQRLAVRAGLAHRGWSCGVLTTEANFTYLNNLRFDPVWTSAARSLVGIVRGQLRLQA